MTERVRRLHVERQPTETTCGPTALHGVYRYYEGESAPSLTEIIGSVSNLEAGGTLGVMLANHALDRGYEVVLYTYNLQVFDPTWFMAGVDLAERLELQRAYKSSDLLLAVASEAYLYFLRNGGELRFEEISSQLVRRHLSRGEPVLAGLSSTYLYWSAREIPETTAYDDIKGEPAGHFVVLAEEDEATGRVRVADPYRDNPLAGSGDYFVTFDRLVGALFLGVLTYDANLLVVRPKVE
jgi:hypothetical protein